MSAHALHIVRRGLVAIPLACAMLCACQNVPTLLPPPFGPDPTAPQKPRLFYPTGIALAPVTALDGTAPVDGQPTKGGQLLVANGNWDHAFAGGTIVALDPGYIDSFYAQPPVDPTDPTQPVPVDIPPSAFVGAVMIGNYAGPLTFDQTGLNAFTGSRDTSFLNAVTLDPVTGALTCMGNGDTDCRDGFLDVGDLFTLLGPYAIVPGFSRLPGTTVDTPVMFVSALIPHIDGVISGSIYTSSTVAALTTTDAANPRNALWSGQVSNYLVAGGVGAGPMVFDPQRRKLMLGGCYTRFTGQTVGDPSSGKCSTTTTANLIRFVGVDEGANPDVQVTDIATLVNSTDTEGLALGNYVNNDPVNGLAQTLYVITRTPDVLAEITIPTDPTALVQITRATEMPIFPADVIRLNRPPDQPGPDLMAVSLESSEAIDIYDTSAGQVVGQVENLGISPTSMVQFPVHAGDETARIAVTVFQDCRVSLIDVSFARPWEVRLRGRLGSCPVAPP